MTIILPLLVALIGLFLYVLATGAKLQEIGRISFAVGLLVSLFQVAGHTISLLR